MAEEGCGRVIVGSPGSNDCTTMSDEEDDVANVIPSGDIAILLM